ncbi:unnamed protein product [Amaranthus hypochondriacus]
MMTLDKPSKWSRWKSNFYLVSSPSLPLDHRLRHYNKHPTLLGKKCALPRVPEEAWTQIMETMLFKKTSLPLDDGTEVIVPKNWVPHPDWLKEEALFFAYSLRTMFSRQKGLEMVRPEKTPAKSVAQIQKDKLEKKRAQLAAKDDGTESKNFPCSLTKMLKRPGEPASKSRRVPAAPAS